MGEGGRKAGAGVDTVDDKDDAGVGKYALDVVRIEEGGWRIWPTGVG